MKQPAAKTCYYEQIAEQEERTARIEFCTERQQTTQITQTLKRKDGSEVRIIAQAFFGRGLTLSIGVDVYRRENPQHNWKLCSDRPHPNWREMSVEEYTRHGRSEMLQAVSPGEILRMTNAIGKPMDKI